MDLYSVLETYWADICSRYPPGLIEASGILIAQVIGFLIPASLYTLIDVLFPDFSRRHKIQEPQKQPTTSQIWNSIGLMLFNNVWPVAAHFTIAYYTDFQLTSFIIDPELPSVRAIAVDFIFGLLAREVTFYYIHRGLHHPSIYAYIHKKHHMYTAPVSFAAEYAHPVEHIVANMLPIIVPMAIKGTHFVSVFLFVVFELWEAAADHSGYDFVKLPPAKHHDLHHAKSRVNYSTLGLMDWLHGTDVLGWDRPKKKAMMNGEESKTL